MINIVYDPDDGIVLPDNKVIPFAEEYVQKYIVEDSNCDLLIGSRDIIYAFLYAMKNKNVDHTQLKLEYVNSTNKAWVDSAYNINGHYEFSDHVEKILLALF